MRTTNLNRLSPQNNRSRAGFTLIELLVTMAIFGIGISIAVPNYKSMVSGNRIVAQINNFKGAMSFARSEAIKRGTAVSVVPITGADWAQGWIIEVKSTNEVLNRSDAFSGGTALKPSATAARVDFTGEGRVNMINDLVFTLCNKVTSSKPDKVGKQLSLSPTGITYLNANFTCP